MPVPDNLAALDAELAQDPANLGYATIRAGAGTASEKAVLLAAKLNATDTGRTRNRGVIPTYLMYDRVDVTEYAALTAANKDRLRMILAMGHVNANSPVLQADLEAIFPANAVTLKNFAGLAGGSFQGDDLRKVIVSRAQELELGFAVTPGDVAICEAN